MAGCGKSIEYTIPKGYSYKTIEYKCGNTGIDGYPVFCDKCEELNKGIDWRQHAIDNGENFDDDY